MSADKVFTFNELYEFLRNLCKEEFVDFLTAEGEHDNKKLKKNF